MPRARPPNIPKRPLSSYYHWSLPFCFSLYLFFSLSFLQIFLISLGYCMYSTQSVYHFINNHIQIIHSLLDIFIKGSLMTVVRQTL